MAVGFSNPVGREVHAKEQFVVHAVITVFAVVIEEQQVDKRPGGSHTCLDAYDSHWGYFFSQPWLF